MRRGLAFALGMLASLALASAPGCAEDEIAFPVTPAPPSRHGALREALAADARAFAFRDGAWTEDQGDAAGFGLATLARRVASGAADAEERGRRESSLGRARALLAGGVDAADVALEERVLAAFGVLEHVAAAGANGASSGALQADALAVEEFLDRLDAAVRASEDDLERVAGTSPAVQAYGSTVATGIVALLHAQTALVVSGVRAGERRARAIALEQRLYARAFGDLADPGSAQSARGFASGPGRAGLTLLPNVVMMLLETRLFRLTRDEAFRLGARALFAAIQPLSLGAASRGTRWAEPERATELGATTRDVSSLAGQSALALAQLSVFEVTGDGRYVDEADRIFDALEAMRGPFCASQIGAGTCAPACQDGQACLSGACGPDRCATGLLHHAADGRVAAPGGPGRLFCSGCSFLAQLAIGQRRALAGEGF